MRISVGGLEGCGPNSFGVRGGEQRLRHARTALIVAAVLCAIVALLEIVRRLSETEVG